MYTIDNDIENILVIKNSKFITYLFYISDKNEAIKHINRVQKENISASHVCYAFKTLDEVKFSDDGEPKGTAGLPLISIIEKNNLINILVIVVRYFGGIKLGAGGLIRAYGNSFKEALSVITKVELKDIDKYEIVFSYEVQQNIDYILKDSEIISKLYTDKISYIILTDNFLITKLQKLNITTKYIETIKKRVLNS